MTLLLRALVEKASYDNSFEYMLPEAGGVMTLASARHRSQALVVALHDKSFEVRFQPAMPALLPELQRSFSHWSGVDGVFCLPTLTELATVLCRATKPSCHKPCLRKI